MLIWNSPIFNMTEFRLITVNLDTGNQMSIPEVLITKVDDAESKTKEQLLSCIPLFALSIIIPVLAYNSLFLPINEKPEIWFQRSGSFTVLFSVWAEYNLMKVNDLMAFSTSGYGGTVEYQNKYKELYFLSQYLAIATAITGTFIWGYGDLCW